MAYIIHRDKDRGKGEHGWLSSRFSFSFAEWYNPKRMGFGALRVLNDDTIAPDSGFGAHHHDNMEIITIVMAGAVTHEDSLGNSYAVPAGDVQVMSAGTGVTHAEYNRSATETLKLFQIWIIPREQGIVPRYGQKSFGAVWENNRPQLLVAPDTAAHQEDALHIHQDAYVYRGLLVNGNSQVYTLHDPAHGAYVLVVSGTLEVDGQVLRERDAIGISESGTITLTAQPQTTYLLFEVPLGA